MLLHVFTNKGHGVPQAAEDPVTYHTPPVFEEVGPDRDHRVAQEGRRRRRTPTRCQRRHPRGDGRTTRRSCVLTAAMCQGNKLEKVREDFPERFFDVGICESHAVAFAAGHGEGRGEAGRGHLQHVPPAELRPDFPGGVPPEPAGGVRHGPGRAGRAGRPDAPRRVRHPVHAAVPEHDRAWPPATSRTWSRCSSAPSSTPGPIAIRYPKANLETARRGPDAAGPGRARQGRGDRLGRGRLLRRLRHAAVELRARPRRSCGRRGSTSASSTPGS